jgi:hypothetical protein
MTSSPGSTVASRALKITCLPPEETVICSGRYCRPFSRLNLQAMAALSASVPSTLVYFVSPRRMAAIAASLMFSGCRNRARPRPSR